MMGHDKKKAQRQDWRTPESTLLGVACFGGSLGVWLGMRHYHHKTKHYKFTLGVPAILVVQLLLVGYLMGSARGIFMG